jgi:hypothetical protein
MQRLQSFVGDGIVRNVRQVLSFTIYATFTLSRGLNQDVKLTYDLAEYRPSQHCSSMSTLSERRPVAESMSSPKTIKVRKEGYDAPKEQSTVSTVSGAEWQEQDIGYHSGYGAEETQGPLESSEKSDMGYHDRFFHE